MENSNLINKSEHLNTSIIYYLAVIYFNKHLFKTQTIKRKSVQ